MLNVPVAPPKYYIDRASGADGSGTDRLGGETRLRYLDFGTGRTIFYSRVDASVDELMLVDNFR